MKQENDEIKKDVASGDGFGTTGTTSEGKKYVYVKLQSQKPQQGDEPVQECLDGVGTDADEPRTGKRTFKPKPSGNPAGTAPLLVPQTTVGLMQKNIVSTPAQLQQLHDALRDGVGIYYNAETGEWGNLLNANPARALFGVICEFSRQSESIQDYFKYVQGVTKENKKSKTPQRIQSITAPRRGGFPVLGYPKEKLTADERELLIDLKVKPGEPVCFLYLQDFVKSYFGIDIQGAERGRYLGYIFDVSNIRFAWEHDGFIYTSQLFTVVTKTNTSGKTLVLVKLTSPVFYENIATEFLKLNQHTHAIQRQTKRLFEMRLYLLIVDEWRKRHKFGKQNRISMTRNIDELIEACATQEELNQRKPKLLQKRMYDYLQILVAQGVLLSFSHQEFNTDGIISIEIAKNPFTFSQTNDMK